MSPRVFWRQNFNNYSSEALDVLRIVASFVPERIDSGVDTLYDAVYTVTDNSLLHVNLLTLLYQVRAHVGVTNNREAARHVVSAIESGAWWPVSVKPNKP
jgi:hypothetical protein